MIVLKNALLFSFLVLVSSLFGQSETELYSHGLVVPNTVSSNSIPISGMIRFNTDSLDFEGYDGSVWKSLTGLPSTTPTPQYAVGDFAEGGVVFWVSPDGSQGKVVSTVSLNGGTWRSPPGYVGAISDSNGQLNSETIVSAVNHTGSAAQRCLDHVINDYEDWYLPAKNEILELFRQSEVVNPVILDWLGDVVAERGWYWTSTEENGQKAYVGQNYATPTSEAIGQNYSAEIRAIRQFTINP